MKRKGFDDSASCGNRIWQRADEVLIEEPTTTQLNHDGCMSGAASGMMEMTGVGEGGAAAPKP
jgi:hypothetical protein